MEVEQKYNEIRRPVYLRRNEIIKSIPDFWLTAVCNSLWLSNLASEYIFVLEYVLYSLFYFVILYPTLQFLSHPALSELITEEDQKVCMLPLFSMVKFWDQIYQLYVHLYMMRDLIKLLQCLNSLNSFLDIDFQIFGFIRC